MWRTAAASAGASGGVALGKLAIMWARASSKLVQALRAKFVHVHVYYTCMRVCVYARKCMCVQVCVRAGVCV